jgi:hypothetical protein
MVDTTTDGEGIVIEELEVAMTIDTMTGMQGIGEALTMQMTMAEAVCPKFSSLKKEPLMRTFLNLQNQRPPSTPITC